MRDVDTLFDGLRDRVVPHVTGPEPDRIIGRARARRTRHRLIAGGLATAVAAGLFFLPGEAERETAPVLTPSPTATTSPAPQERPLKSEDLVHAEAATKGDRKRWKIIETKWGPLDFPTCSGFSRPDTFHLFSDSESEIPDLETGLYIGYDGSGEDLPHPGSDDGGPLWWSAGATLAEHVLVFADEATARSAMDHIVEATEACTPKEAVVNHPAIGDEAISSVSTDPEIGDAKGVAVRKGRVIAVYSDGRLPAGREQASLDDHERDAREMVEKLAAFGY
ncbi:hypothetical protein [Actinocorallia aurantiaca]|uniref:Uncharacterized protein n=1 Tax=Actinocorallia aurantiaca TaxID=46204 RepID=A0ABN3TTG9_9ACTN